MAKGTDKNPGLKNAQSKPFRLNGGGLFPLYMRKILGPVLSASIGRPPK